jgi:DNA-binding transcriptional ArsR family regulator
MVTSRCNRVASCYRQVPALDHGWRYSHVTMALADQARSGQSDTALRVTVAPSAAVELYWLTMLGADGGLRLGHPSLSSLRAGDLVDRLADFWGVSGTTDATAAARSFPELLVLADRGGVLTSSGLDQVIAVAADAGAVRAGQPRLGSETPTDKGLIVDRLAALARSRTRRRAWATLLGDVAGVVGDHWQEIGLEVSRRAARARASQLPWTDPVGAVLGWARRDYDGLLPALLHDAVTAHRPVLVVPSYWSGSGAMFDLDTHLLVAIPAQLGATDSRVRTEPFVRVLKAMADPTRLAILDSLVGRPRTVGEVAADFGLAQPTASRHVRLLRDAGLIFDGRRAGATMVQADTAAIARFAGDLVGALTTEERDVSAGS